MTIPSPDGMRIPPQLPPGAMKTYQVLAPGSTHYRSATCEEVGCAAYSQGWRTTLDLSTELGQRQAEYIRKESGRKYSEERPDGVVATFFFEPGQRCFARHRVRVGRPEIYVVREGDWRGNPRGISPRRHTRPEHWVEDFGEHQQKLADRLKEG